MQSMSITKMAAGRDMLAELSRREKEAGIKPDLELDAIMKATSIPGMKTSLITDYALKMLGLDICSDTLVGDDMRRGVSGGQKKHLTTGEMLVGPTKAFLMDEISTGLDSSATFQIVNYMRQIVHIMDVTMVISLLQPAPETYNLFDDVILLSEGGYRDNVCCNTENSIHSPALLNDWIPVDYCQIPPLLLLHLHILPLLHSVTVKTLLGQNLGFDHDFLPLLVFLNMVFILLFVLIFGFGIKCLNYQKRY
ncbi:hypothetical protein SASPL_155158 [Salvia splendens]|uniref:ATP-binding cassette, subfamily G (WHITE), member 2 n=1 Tax=Salvia splendens TaxID=180675 RepID=A0A8X8W166_SALSN|nr:hypothetical protein SASPL_155158 [Salvia splendens]